MPLLNQGYSIKFVQFVSHSKESQWECETRNTETTKSGLGEVKIAIAR